MKAVYWDFSDRFIPEPRALVPAVSNDTEPVEEQEVEVDTTGDVNDSDGILHLNEVDCADEDLEPFIISTMNKTEWNQIDLRQCTQNLKQIMNIVFKELQTNKTVTILDLSYNPVGDIVAEYVSQLLNSNETLNEISMRLTNLTSTGVDILCCALQNNTTINKLNLSLNDSINDDCLQSLLEMFQNNSALRELDLGDCCFSEPAKTQLRKAIKTKNMWLNL